MLKNQGCGWSKFTFNDFAGKPSYLTNAPLDLLNAFINYHTDGAGIAWFDEEGSEFTFILKPDVIYIIEERAEEPIVHTYPIDDITNLEIELINDIESDIDNWQYFMTNDEDEDINQNRKELLNSIELLKKYVKK